MTDKLMTYYSFTLEGEDHYFSSLRKLERFKKSRPVDDGSLVELKVPVSVAKELIKLSKKKPKEKCPECGK